MLEEYPSIRTVCQPADMETTRMVRVPQLPQSSHDAIVFEQHTWWPVFTRIQVSYPLPHELKVYEPATGA
mgnify:CR=1 FL=1